MTDLADHTPRARRRRTRVAKYAAFARVGYSRARAESADAYGRIVFLFLIVGVFSSLWRAVAASGGRVADDARTLVWYLAITEWVLISPPHLQFEIEDDVRRGDVAYQLVRPASYLGARFAEGIGALSARLPLLFAGACAAAWVFGGMPAHPALVLRAAVFGALASVLVTAYNVLIGLASFWLGDIAPVYWIWQKLLFMLGGLLLPLSMYPELVVRVARATPFSAMVGGPASFVLGRPLFDGATLIVLLGVWAAVALVASVLAFRQATARLQLNGG